MSLAPIHRPPTLGSKQLRRWLLALGCGVALATGSAAAAEPSEEAWQDIRASEFGDQPIRDGAGVIALEAPYRAYDAAIVPITMVAGFPQSPERYVRKITLVIDENPAPVAAVFELTPMNGLATIATRVRVNAYTHVRAIAETNDGELYMAKRYVKAAGGCSAPASKNRDAASARLGKMKLKHMADTRIGQPSQVQLLISHPNASGLQMDQVTRNYIPARFVQDITVAYGGQTIMTVEGAISLSEDPSIHFYFVPSGPGELSVEATDSDGTTFTGSWPITPKAGS